MADLAEVFLDSLRASHSGVERASVPPPAPVEGEGMGTFVQILESNVRSDLRSIQSVVEAAVMQV